MILKFCDEKYHISLIDPPQRNSHVYITVRVTCILKGKDLIENPDVLCEVDTNLFNFLAQDPDIVKYTPEFSINSYNDNADVDICIEL